MKKKVFMSLGLVGIIALSVSIGAYAATALKVTINGASAKLDVKVIDKVNYVPLNALAALVGLDVKTDTKTSVITINGKVPSLPIDGVYKAGDLRFYDVSIKPNSIGWEIAAEVKNAGSKIIKGSNFTVTFYGADGKRVGTAIGTTQNLGVAETKTESLMTMDDLTNYKTFKFQIDISY